MRLWLVAVFSMYNARLLSRKVTPTTSITSRLAGEEVPPPSLPSSTALRDRRDGCACTLFLSPVHCPLYCIIPSLSSAAGLFFCDPNNLIQYPHTSLLPPFLLAFPFPPPTLLRRSSNRSFSVHFRDYWRYAYVLLFGLAQVRLSDSFSSITTTHP